jgi:hypothetical protein
LGFIGNMPAKHIKDAKVGATELVPQPFAINHLQALIQRTGSNGSIRQFII